MSTTTAIARRDAELRHKVQEVCLKIASPRFSAQIAQALPENLSLNRFTRTALTAIQQNPAVVDADRGSLFQSLTRAAMDGLLPDGREAALVIFKNKDGKRVVTYMPMVGGLRKIAAEHGWTLSAHVVYAKDDFDYELGANPYLIHKPPPFGQPRGDKLGAYAVATHEDGRKVIEEPMNAEQILKVRRVSRAANSGPWVDWEERMWEKTLARRLFANLPLASTDERVERIIKAADEESDLDGEYAEADLPGIGEFIDADPLPALPDVDAPLPEPEPQVVGEASTAPQGVPVISPAVSTPGQSEASSGSESGEPAESLFKAPAAKPVTAP